MGTKVEIRLGESQIRYNDQGEIVHHPLNSKRNRNWDSYGNITFSGRNLAVSPLLQDIKVFYIEIYSDPRDLRDQERESWANPIRAQILNSLFIKNYCWYLSFFGHVKDKKNDAEWILINEPIQQKYLDPNGLEYTSVKSENLWWRQAKNYFIDRIFFEIPKSWIDEITNEYWSLSVPGHTIQGFLMPEKSIGQLDNWNHRERDDQLFDEVMDFVDICFYTYPAENHDLIFLTRNYSLDEFSKKINFPELEKLVASH